MVEAISGMSHLQRRIAAISGPKPREKMMKLIGETTVGYAKENARPHRKTSHLEHSIHVARYDADSVDVVAAISYAAYVELGTRAHVITPKVAKVLAWGGPRRLSGALRKGGKATNFAMIVHHPGTKPQPYLVPAAKRALEETGASVIIDAWNSTN